MDRGDTQGHGVPGDADAESPDEDKGAVSAPGSLMSLRIRKRTAPSPGRAAPPPAAPAATLQPEPAEPAEPSGPAEPTAPAADSDPVTDAISRVARRARLAREARPPLPPRRRAPRAPVYRAPETDFGTGAPPASPPASPPSDIVAYWSRLRGGRRFPKSAEIDAGTVAEAWPNSILIRCRPGSRALEPDKMFLAGDGFAPGLARLRGGGRINLSPMMLQWLLGLAGEVVREGRPMNDVETFPSVKRVVHYRAVALPFSDDDNAVDHVLCHFRPEA